MRTYPDAHTNAATDADTDATDAAAAETDADAAETDAEHRTGKPRRATREQLLANPLPQGWISLGIWAATYGIDPSIALRWGRPKYGHLRLPCEMAPLQNLWGMLAANAYPNSPKPRVYEFAFAIRRDATLDRRAEAAHIGRLLWPKKFHPCTTDATCLCHALPPLPLPATAIQLLSSPADARTLGNIGSLGMETAQTAEGISGLALPKPTEPLERWEGAGLPSGEGEVAGDPTNPSDMPFACLVESGAVAVEQTATAATADASRAAAGAAGPLQNLRML